MLAHFDIDAFYASVAQLDTPALRGQPIAVAGNSRRAVVLTASYEARPFGVRSAMPLFKALELCPQLVVVRPNFERYRELSRAVFAIFAGGAVAVEGLSLDEAFVDLGELDFDAALAYGRAVRGQVRADVGLTVSAGISMQKMVAKIASEDAKPDGLRAIPPGDEARYLAPLAVGRLLGIGPKSQARLSVERVETIGQLAALSDTDVHRLFGRAGRILRELARGNDTRTVSADRETRSVSAEQTFERDLQTVDEVQAALRETADDVAARLTAHGLRGSTIGIKLKRSNFTIVVRQTTVAEPTSDRETIYEAAVRCLERAELRGSAIRLVGVRVAALTEEDTEQLTLFA